MKMLLRTAIAIAVLVAALTGYWAHLGYFGGDVYVPVAAKGRPAPGLDGIAVVIVSGDMGFRTGMGPQIGARFADHGVPVLGIDSLVYFRQRRSPAEIRELIADAVRRGLAFGHARRLVLIGQSFGADMVHVGLTGLPPALRAKLAMVALVVPTDTVDYQASPLELLDLVRPDAPAIATGRQLTWVPTVCIQGRDETDSLCPMLTAPNVRKVALPGGHPLHRDADALFGALTQAISTAVPAQR
jgi:type IV secretory pathway VirJ component